MFHAATLRLLGLTVVLSGLNDGAGGANLPIEIQPSPNGQVVTAGGSPFAEYHVESGGKPVVWPLVGPNGFAMTRQWPMAELGPQETDNNRHHRGLWFGHGSVNGIDFWRYPGASAESAARSGRGRVVHREFVSVLGGDTDGTIVTRNDWIGPNGEAVCHDERTLRFGATPTLRWVDFLIELHPGDEPLRLGDSKEGMFAVRVAGQLRVDAELGGEIVNSNGQRNGDAWGERAEWVDYFGRIDDQAVGLAILSHPSNFRARPRWHVRGYGLFAANPVGEEDFAPINGYQQGPLTVNLGDHLRLRYRVVLHLGNERHAGLDALHREYGSQ